MNFYVYSQNNSGGVFIGPKYVIIQANSADEADDIAVNGDVVYFNGCATGNDCSCCGDRWSKCWDDPYDNLEDAISHCRKWAYDPDLKDEILIVEDLEGYQYEHMVGLFLQEST